MKYKYVTLNEENWTILIDTGVPGYVYDIDLDRCKTAGACLDWIHQVHVKTWCNAERETEFIDLLFEMIPTNLWSGK